MARTIITDTVLYGRENLVSLHRVRTQLRVLENRVLREYLGLREMK
jgi:hypothetical protein